MKALLAIGIVFLASPALAEDLLHGPVDMPSPLPPQIIYSPSKPRIPAPEPEPPAIHIVQVPVPTQTGQSPWYIKAYNGFMYIPRKVFMQPAAAVGQKIGVQDMTKRFWDREQQSGEWVTRRLGWTSLPAQWLTAGAATYGAGRNNSTTRF